MTHSRTTEADLASRYWLTDKGWAAAESTKEPQTMTLTPTPETEPIVVEPDAESRLAQLHAAYADAKAQADESAARLKTITDAIKLELTQAAPEGETRIELRGSQGPALRLVYSESWRVDSKKLKAESPETYVRYAKKSGSWTLKAAAPGEQ